MNQWNPAAIPLMILMKKMMLKDKAESQMGIIKVFAKDTGLRKK